MARIQNLDELLSSEDLNGSIVALDNFIGGQCSYGDELDNLTRAQAHFYLNQNLEREVNNGGFQLYFSNSSGDFAHQTIESLKAINATTTAAILQRAIDLFPDGKVPPDRNVRADLMEHLPETVALEWGKLDEKFFKYEDDLNSLNRSFVRANRDEF